MSLYVVTHPPVDRRIRIHEAGHALCGILLGVPFTEIRQDTERVAMVAFEGMPSVWSDDCTEVEAALLVRLAGPVADSLHGGFDAVRVAWDSLPAGLLDIADPRRSLLQDLWWSRVYVCALTSAREPEALWEAIQPYRSRVVRLLADHWRAVNALADEMGVLWGRGEAVTWQRAVDVARVAPPADTVHAPGKSH